MSTADVYDGLEPKGLWRHFAAINGIARPSRSEGQLASYIRCWAKDHNFTVKEDDARNLCIWVPATEGRKNAVPVVLQGHLDMVCEKNSDSPYDAEKARIHVVRDGEWIRADGTTLGADNGIGVSAMLHVADATAIAHGPLDLLFTVEEETGLIGAGRLDPSIVRGRLLLNLDSEEDGALFVGCAGACEPTFSWTIKPEPTPRGLVALQVSVFGLKGGHSGVDIIEDRLNAIRAMARLLDRGAEAGGLRIASISGGKQRNAIPRECTAVVLCQPDKRDEIAQAVHYEHDELRAQYRDREGELKVKVEDF
jgi:dipeptidase D